MKRVSLASQPEDLGTHVYQPKAIKDFVLVFLMPDTGSTSKLQFSFSISEWEFNQKVELGGAGGGAALVLSLRLDWAEIRLGETTPVFLTSGTVDSWEPYG